jgi:hypothetical protein
MNAPVNARKRRLMSRRSRYVARMNSCDAGIGFRFRPALFALWRID